MNTLSWKSRTTNKPITWWIVCGYVALILYMIPVTDYALALDNKVPSSNAVILTDEENSWLKTHPEKLTLFFNTEFPPIEFISESGSFTGMGADVISRIESLLGIDFIKSPLEDWNRHLAALKSGECAIAPTIVRTSEREMYSFFTKPYATVPVVVITPRTTSAKITLNDLAGWRVGVVSGYATEIYLRNKTLQERFELVTVDNVSEGLRRTAFGQIDAFVENLAVAAYYIELEGIPSLRVAGTTDYQFAWCIGVSREYPLLYSVINKAMEQISTDEMTAIKKKWVAMEVDFEMDPKTRRNLILTVLFSVLLLSVLTGITIFLKRRLDQNIAGLKESEEKYRQLFDNAVEGVFQTTPDGGFLSANPSLARILGYNSTSELIEQFQDIGKQHYLNPEDREAFLRIMETDGKTSDFELQLRKRDGSRIWASIKGRAVRDESGHIHHFEGLLEDITDRKRVEEELKASERRARLQRAALSDLALNQAFVESDASAMFRLITKYLTQTLDISRASIWVLSEDDLKLSCRALYESDKDVFSSGTELQASGMPRYFKAIMQENRIYAEDAQNDPRTSELTDAYLKPLGITSMLDAGIIMEGQVKGVVCTEHIGPVRKWFPDEEAFISTISALVAQLIANTKRKRAEVSLRESEQRYRTILNEMAEGYHEVDLAGNFIFFNEAFLNLFGYSGDEMKGTNFSRYAADKTTAKRIYRTYNETYRTGVPIQSCEWDILRKDGERRALEFYASLLRNSKGIATGFRGIVRDITQAKRAELEREKLQAQLLQAQKMEAIGNLAGGIAHDFNNMLGVILGHVELALKKIEEDNSLHKTLNKIQDAALRSADLTRQLLAFARKQTISPRVLDLNNTVQGMLNLLLRVIGEDIDLAWEPGRNLCPVRMDPTQIDQILANLCVNARDAISGVGKITIETDNTVLDEFYCAGHIGFLPGEYVMLAVSDNGCGMNSETLSHLFEPFFTTKEVGKGTGLGLATVYGIIKQNNGFINVYSEPGLGTTVKIYLPCHAAQTDIEPQITGPKTLVRGYETILLVEDEPMILEMTTTMLEELGYRVLSAPSPGESIRLAKEHPDQIHLLMTDVVMPAMNGRDLAGRFTALYPDLKLLFMSGYTANVIAHQGVLDEGVAFIQKPFSMADLAEKVRGVLDMAPDKVQD